MGLCEFTEFRSDTVSPVLPQCFSSNFSHDTSFTQLPASHAGLRISWQDNHSVQGWISVSKGQWLAAMVRYRRLFWLCSCLLCIQQTLNITQSLARSRNSQRCVSGMIRKRSSCDLTMASVNGAAGTASLWTPPRKGDGHWLLKVWSHLSAYQLMRKGQWGGAQL